MYRIRKTIVAALLLLVLLPLTAKEQADTVHTFRFVPGRDMFYVPWSGNDAELARLEACVAQWKAQILAGDIPVLVDGYCASAGSEAENLAVAKIRSNRVKSELIVRQGLVEACFTTHNHSGDGDYVTVRIFAPKENDAASQDAERLRQEQLRLEAERQAKQKEQERLAREREEAEKERERAEAERLAAEQSARQAGMPAEGPEADSGKGYALSLRANLLRWATLTPDLGIEWRINPSWGILVNGSWTSWSWNDKDRRYALWEVMPELRYYAGKEKRGYVGAMFKAGEFNYKLSATGRQGDLMGGGITGGYQLRLNDALSLDFNVAVGCLHTDYEKYTVVDGVRVRAGNDTKNWWGPVNAGVTLVWKLF